MSQREGLDAEAHIRDICSVDIGVVKKIYCMVQEKVLFFYIELELGKKKTIQIFTFIL